jgi:hypothetical protein
VKKRESNSSVKGDNSLTKKDYKLFLLGTSNSLLTGVVVALVVFFLQRWLNTPTVHFKEDTSVGNRCLIQIRNTGRVPAYSLVCYCTASAPVSTHEQTPGVFWSQGKIVDSKTLFSGRDKIDFRCEVLPPGATYELSLSFDQVLLDRPKVNVMTAAGPADEE